jgi:hypothetical protein
VKNSHSVDAIAELARGLQNAILHHCPLGGAAASGPRVTFTVTRTELVQHAINQFRPQMSPTLIVIELKTNAPIEITKGEYAFGVIVLCSNAPDSQPESFIIQNAGENAVADHCDSRVRTDRDGDFHPP